MSVIQRESREYTGPTLFDRSLDLSRINLEVIAFAGLVVVSIITHLWALGHMAMHHDESIHAWTTWRIYTGSGGFTCAGYEGQQRTSNTYCYDPVYHGPSLYVLTLISFFLFGDGDAQSRIPEAAAGILLVASTWMLRPYLGRRGTFIAGVLLALTPSLLYFTRFARHDALLLLWTLWMVIGFFRYLDTGQARYLYLLAIGTGLAIATHELYYILFFLFGAFVLIRVLAELLPRRRVMIGLAVVLALALGLIALDLPLTSSLRSGGLALLFATLAGLGLLLIRAWDDTPIVTARALELWRNQRPILWTALGILAAIYVLMYTFFLTDPGGITGIYWGITYWLGSQHAYQRADQPWYYYVMMMPLYEPIALLGSIGATIYLFARRPASAVSEPAAAPVANEEDGEQVPAGEITAVDEGAPDGEAEQAEQPVHAVQPADDGAATVAEVTPVPTTEQPAKPLDTPPASGQTLFPLFLAFWFIAIFVALSWAGEKMPWLVTHIALPGNLFAAWALGRIMDFGFAPQNAASNADNETLVAGSRTHMWLIPAVFVLTLVSLGVALWRLNPTGEGQQAQASLLQGLIPLIIAGGLIYCLLTIGQSAGIRLTLALCGFTVAVLLGVYTIRATWMVVYNHPDTPRELMIYTQSSPDVPLISRDLHLLAINQTRNMRTASDPTGGHTMPLIMDTGDANGDYTLAWPYQWYLRDFQRIENRQADFFRNATADSFLVAADNTQPDGEKIFAPAVMVAVPHMTETTRQALEENYTRRYNAKLNWWFPEGNECAPDSPGYKRYYFNSWNSLETLTRPLPSRRATGCGADVAAKLYPPWAPLVWPFQPANWGTLKNYLLYRDLPSELGIYGREMEVWVRKDLVGGGEATEGGSAGPLKLVAQTTYGAPGTESGLLDQPRGVAVDQQGNVYVTDTGNHRIQVFGPDGTFIRAIGAYGSGEGQFNEPRGIAIDMQGNIYVADTWNARIVKLDPEGNFLKSWGEGKQDFGEGRRATITDGSQAALAAEPLGFFGPRSVAVDTQGNVYIADTGNKRIVVTDIEGQYLYQWGYSGSAPGAFNEPVGVAVDSAGTVYVADIWNSRVQMFVRGETGQVSPNPLATWRISGWQPNSYDDPSIGVGDGGKVIVSVPSRNLIAYTDATGQVLLRWGGKGTDQASVNLPSGAAVGADGSVYVVDRGNARVMKFTLPNVQAPSLGR